MDRIITALALIAFFALVVRLLEPPQHATAAEVSDPSAYGFAEG